MEGRLNHARHLKKDKAIGNEMLLPLILLLLLQQPEAQAFSTCSVPTRRPEKRVATARMAVKALVTAKYDEDDGGMAELWILDVYKGAEKLAAAVGVLGGSEVVHHLRDK